MKAANAIHVVGKICPCCGRVGSVLFETETRIVYECPNKHQYETRKWPREKRELGRNSYVIDRSQWLG
jgi:hypothetical protein